MEARPTQGPWMEAGREAALVLGSQNGELPAMLELVRWYQRPLWRLCFVLSRSQTGAEQLLQESVRRGWRNIKQLPVGQPFYPWITRTARTLAVANARRDAGAYATLPPVRPDGNPWHRSARDVAYEQRVLTAFADLTVDEQLLLALRVIERLTYTDVSATSGLALVATMNRIAAAREHLEQRLEGRQEAA